jgi:hypothetical protein
MDGRLMDGGLMTPGSNTNNSGAVFFDAKQESEDGLRGASVASSICRALSDCATSTA